VNFALLVKTLRDSRVLLIVLALAIVGFEFLFLRAISEFGDDMLRFWAGRPAFAKFAKIVLGAELGDNITKTMLVIIGFAHPFLYACVWAFILATVTRSLAGELDRGTADLLLSLPLSRTTIYITITVAWVLCGIVMNLAPLVGIWISKQYYHDVQAPDMHRLRLLCANLFMLYLAIGGITALAATLVARRGPAIAIVLGVLLASVLINFLANFWPPAERLAFLGLLDYYKPLPIVTSGQFPQRNAAVLAGVALVAWLLGLWRFQRRDIPAV
jgi:ABC-2 type transport system permease protein